MSNIIAVEAPSGGKGIYTLEQITNAFQTAFTAFSAAKEEGIRAKGNSTQTIINTGDWGTGAYGGNKVLMAFLQLLAAMAARIEKVHFYTTDSESVKQAESLVAEFLPDISTAVTQDILSKLFSMGFHWGVSDGN